MLLTGQYQLSVGVSAALRQAFRQHHQFRWDPNEALTKIGIHDSYPLKGMRLPAIVVRVTGGNALLRGIGEEVATTTTTEASLDGASYGQVTSILYSGNLRMNVLMEILARNAYDRAQIADWTVLFLRHFAVDKFQNQGVYVEAVDYGAQTEELVGTDPVYRTSVNLRCLTSFAHEVPNSVVNTLVGISLTGVFSTLPNGVTLSESAS